MRSVCAEAKCQPQDLAGVVVTLGPGSFTGQRLALAFASGLQVAIATANLGFTSTLLAATTAQRLLLGRGISRGRVLVLLDSRRTEPFAQTFSLVAGAEPQEEGEIISCSRAGLPAYLQDLAQNSNDNTPWFVCGDALEDSELNDLVASGFATAEVLDAVGRGALQDLVRLGRTASHLAETPLRAVYVRPPDTSAPRQPFTARPLN